jgi:hypothetical protein
MLFRDKQTDNVLPRYEPTGKEFMYLFVLFISLFSKLWDMVADLKWTMNKCL